MVQENGKRSRKKIAYQVTKKTVFDNKETEKSGSMTKNTYADLHANISRQHH